MPYVLSSSVPPVAPSVLEVDSSVPSLIDLIAHSGADDVSLPTLSDARELQAVPTFPAHRILRVGEGGVPLSGVQRLQLLSAQVAAERRRGDNLFRELVSLLCACLCGLKWLTYVLFRRRSS